MKRFSFSLLMAISIPLLLLLSVISFITGAVSIPLSDIMNFGDANFRHQHSGLVAIIFELRLPRTLLAILIGAILGLCGACLQGLFRNALADPGIIGVSAGAALGAGIAIVLLPSSLLVTLLPSTFNLNWMILSSTSLFAFIGGLITTFLVFKIGQTPYGTNVGLMLLSGVAIGALAFSALGFLQFLASDSQLRDLTLWQMGSLAGANRNTLLLSLFTFIFMSVLLFPQANSLNALLLGESEARHLGVAVEKLKRKIIVVCALGVGISVAAAGIIGFIGLVVPHICRTLLGPDHSKVLPSSAVIGASILLAADIFARQIAAPAEIPIGIITALIGAPFFLALLLSQKQRGTL